MTRGKEREERMERREMVIKQVRRNEQRTFKKSKLK